MTSKKHDEGSPGPRQSKGFDPFDLRDTTKDRRIREEAVGLPVGLPPTPKVQLSREQKFRRGLALGIGATLTAMLIFWSGISVLQHWRLSRVIGQAEASRGLDSYAGHVDALEALIPVAENTRILPPLLDRVIFEGIGPMPGTAVRTLREEMQAQTAVLAAVVEWRFEEADSRKAGELLDGLEHSAPEALAGRIYGLLLAGEELDALALSRESWALHGDDEAVQTAVAEALLRFDADDEREAVIAALRHGEKEHARRQFLAAALEDQRESQGKAASLEALASKMPESIDALIALGMTRAKDGEAGSELKARLEPVVALDPPQIGPYQKGRALHALGLLSLAQNMEDEAIGYLRRAIEAAPARLDLYPALVDVYIEGAKYADALEALEGMEEVARDKPQPALLSRRGRTLLLTGKPEEALAELEKTSVHSAESQWVKGLVLLELRRESEARKAFEAAAAFKNAPPAARAFALYGRKISDADADGSALLEELAAMAEDDSSCADVGRAHGLAMLHEAESLASRNRRRQWLQRGRERLLASLEKNPRHVLVAYDICRVEMLLAHAERADEACRGALRLSGAYAAGMADLIRLRLIEERYDQALQLVFRLRESLAGARAFENDVLEVEALIGLRRFEEAEKTMESWRTLTGAEEVERLVLQGKLAFAQHLYLDALEPLERAYEADPSHEEAALRLAHAWVKTGYWDEADPILRELLSSPRWGAEAWYALGELRRRQERFADARTNLRRATERLGEHIAPGRLHVLVNTELALAWQNRFNWNHAQVSRHLGLAARRAEEYGVAVPEYLVIEGVFHLAKRRPEPELAREAIEKAVELDPLYCDGWTALAAAYRVLGERAELRRLSSRRPGSCS